MRLLPLLIAILAWPAAAGADPTRIEISVDAAEAVDPLIKFKIHQTRLEVTVDGEVVAETEGRKPPAGDVVWQSDVPPGEHVIGVRWTVKFRSATDRHHPMGSEPEDQGFSIPDYDQATEVVQVADGETLRVTAKLVRKASLGLQGKSWVEWEIETTPSTFNLQPSTPDLEPSEREGSQHHDQE